MTQAPDSGTGTGGGAGAGTGTGAGAGAGARNDRPGVHIGSVGNSALSIGDHNTVTHVSGPSAAVDPAQAELLAAVRELRADLARFVASDAQRDLDAELSAAEDEISAGGVAGPGLLARLRQALDVAGPLTASLASGAAVAQALTALLRS